MKIHEIKQLSPAEFIYELTNPNSKISQSPIQWTIEWLKANGVSPKLLKGAGDWSGIVNDAQAFEAVKSDKLKCINAVINSNNSRAGKNSGKNMTAEQRSERAKKAVQARIEKYGQKTLATTS